MPKKPPQPTPIEDRGLTLGQRLYRIFLLAVILGVLAVKGYLWVVFTLALVFYLYETIIIPISDREAERTAWADRAQRSEAFPEPPPPDRPRRVRWKWKPEEKRDASEE